MVETLVEFLRDSAQRFGPRPAVLFKPGIRYQRWSYAQLWEESGQVATLLQQRGLQKGDRALLWAPNCPQWVLAFFGCMRAGVIAVPLDLRSAGDFVDRVVSKSLPVIAFVSRVTPEAHRQLDMPTIYMEEIEGLIEAMPTPQQAQVAGADVAEIMFTSGTTGDPKGVMLSHSNLMANLKAVNQFIPGRPSSRLISVLPLSHMFEQMGGLFAVLSCGGNVTYPTSRQPTVLLQTMRERKVTTIVLVPQALGMLMTGIEREVRRQGKERFWSLLSNIARRIPFRLRRRLFPQVHRRFGGCLDFVVSGGAALDPELGRKWEVLGVKIIQGYGATEGSPVITTHLLKRPRFDSAGLPLPGVAVRISEDGEVLVKGPNIMLGYWEATEQTAAAFEDGWYKTGDLGFLDRQGFLHLKGRKKDMIVLPSGQNVFPEDIETALNKHPAVTEAVVVGLPKGAGVEVHAALLLSDQEAAPEVVSWVNQQLAEHQRVQGFTVWPNEDFPRTHTLKVKKNLVVDMLTGGESVYSTAAAATTQVSSASARGLEDLIVEIGGVAREQVTSDKPLAENLNLDSLGRVELLSAIEEERGVYVDENRVGPETTVGQLQELLETGTSAVKPRFPHWGMRWPARVVRGVIQRSFVFPMLQLTYRLRVSGRDGLAALSGPALFTSNHHLPLDNGLILKAFPSRVRRRLAITAAAEMWRSRFWAFVNPLFGNGFPFSREGAVRASLENVGRILDDGWSVLIYPEGEVTIGGPIQPFLSGVGLLAMEARVPVIPMRLHIHDMGSPWKFPIAKRGKIEIRFGVPINFAPGTTYREATEAIESAVKAL